MENLTEHSKSLPINRLKLPGTHNSASYSVDFSKPMINATKFRFSKLLTYLPLIRSIVKGWTSCQLNTLFEQLESGVRFLDLRLSKRESDQIIYCTHTFTCIRFTDALKQINDFTTKYPSEIVLIMLSFDYEFRNASNTPDMCDEDKNRGEIYERLVELEEKGKEIDNLKADNDKLKHEMKLLKKRAANVSKVTNILKT
jgi:hypothetical protein